MSTCSARLAGWMGSAHAIFAHAVRVKLDGLANLQFNFVNCCTSDDAPWRISNMRRKIYFSFFYDDRITHMFRIS